MEIAISPRKTVYVPAVDHFTITKRREVGLLQNFLSLGPTDFVLDVGCGPGYWTHRLARRCAGIIGVDLNIQEIRKARRHFESDHCNFLVSPGENLPFGSAAFDKVISVCALEHFDSGMKGLCEMNRVLKDGGILAISVDSLSNPWITKAQREGHAREHWCNEFYDLDGFRQMLRKAGFELLDHKFLLISRLAFKCHEIYWPNRWLLFPLYPILLATARIADAFKGKGKNGFILVTLAKKFVSGGGTDTVIVSRYHKI